nr:hypothetical protein Iba_scaffold1681461CG0010 [Ipomoea batatas]
MSAHLAYYPDRSMVPSRFQISDNSFRNIQVNWQQRKKAADPPTIAKIRLRGLKLIILWEEDGGEEVGDVESPLMPLSEAGASAAGAMSGDGAGAGVGGISVPKMASGRRTLST